MAGIELKHIQKAYTVDGRTLPVLKDICLQIPENSITVLLGKSGCGKTTFLSMLAGLDLPSDGAVEFGGKTTAELNRDKYRMDDVALICQSFNLFPLLTVLENVMYPMTLRGISAHKAKETAKEKLAAVGLDETYYKRLPDMLSGGEQQRVAIARALASDAKVLLADEPTGNLDTENGKNIIDILKTLAREQGYCVIVVTHDLGIAAEADEVLHLSDGMVKAE